MVLSFRVDRATSRRARRLVLAATTQLAVIVVGALVALTTVACGTRDTSDREGNYASIDGVQQAAPEATDSSAIGATGPVIDEVPLVLEADQRVLWEGEWFEEGADLESSMYDKLVISAGERGFEYQHEYRLVPYSPTSEWSGQLKARFYGPYSARDETTGHVFVLHVDPSDPDARTIEVSGGSPDESPAPDAHPAWLGPADGRYVFNRTVYRAGFDCAEASNPIETAICHNELLALADLEMNVLYRDIVGSMPAERRQRVRVDQRRFLENRNNRCWIDDDVDTACVARLYSDRIVALQQLQDRGLGDGSRFDADYAIALMEKGFDIRADTVARLAMYPLEMKNVGTVEWHADEDGLLLEQTYAETRIVWPCDVEFQYTDMFFVGRDGTVWAAAYVNIHEVFRGLEGDCSVQPLPEYLELDAGRSALAMWTEGKAVPLTQFDTSEEDGLDGWTLMHFLRWTEGVLPGSVGAWLARHPILTFRG